MQIQGVPERECIRGESSQVSQRSLPRLFQRSTVIARCSAFRGLHSRYEHGPLTCFDAVAADRAAGFQAGLADKAGPEHSVFTRGPTGNVPRFHDKGSTRERLARASAGNMCKDGRANLNAVGRQNQCADLEMIPRPPKSGLSFAPALSHRLRVMQCGDSGRTLQCDRSSLAGRSARGDNNAIDQYHV